MKHSEPEEGAFGEEDSFAIGDMVRFRTDPADSIGIITGVVIRPSGIALIVSCAGEERFAYSFELMRYDEYGFSSIGGSN
jgi:hypothetical protein